MERRPIWVGRTRGMSRLLVSREAFVSTTTRTEHRIRNGYTVSARPVGGRVRPCLGNRWSTGRDHHHPLYIFLQTAVAAVGVRNLSKKTTFGITYHLYRHQHKKKKKFKVKLSNPPPIFCFKVNY